MSIRPWVVLFPVVVAGGFLSACEQECATDQDCVRFRPDAVCSANHHCVAPQPGTDSGEPDGGGTDGGGWDGATVAPGEACPEGIPNVCDGPYHCSHEEDGGAACRELWIAVTTTTDPGGTLSGTTAATLVRALDAGTEYSFAPAESSKFPRWTPFGDRVAFAAAPLAGGRPELRIGSFSEPDGGAIIDADDAGTTDFFGLELAPGAELLWASSGGGISLASPLTQAVSTPIAAGAEPAWTSDGRIVYSAGGSVYVSDSSGGSTAAVADGGHAPYPSAATAFVAFQRSANLGDANVTALGWDDELWTTSIGGTEQRVAEAVLAGAAYGYGAVNPSWSPDRAWLAYERVNYYLQGGTPKACTLAKCSNVPARQILLQRIDASGAALNVPIVLTPATVAGTLPAFSPDGAFVAYFSADALVIQQIDPSTGAAAGAPIQHAFAGRHVMSAGEDDARPRWQPK